MPSDDDRNSSDLLATGAALDVLAGVRSEQEDPLLGATLGDYRIVRLIAEGGMSRVYLGERTDGSFDRQVAIKLSPVNSVQRLLRERFLREQGVLASLTHPNITQLYDARVTDTGLPYIVMELVHGKPIDAYCRAAALDARRIVALILQVVDAIAYAHARLIVHRDIKASNVMVDEDGRVRVLDFGIAKLLDAEDEAQTNTAFMTPRSASPEQLLGRPITVASDIYQTGLLLFELLTGRSPFTDQTLEDAIRRAAEDRPLSFDAASRRALPGELLQIVEQCLRSDPAERYPDANTLRSDLEAFLSGYPLLAVGRSPAYRLRKFVVRNSAATAVGALALLVMVGGSIWYGYSLNAARLIAEQRADTSSRLLQAMSSLITDSFEGFIDHNAERQVGSAAVVQATLQDTAALIRRQLDGEHGARGELLLVQSDLQRTLGDYEEARSALEEAQALLGERASAGQRLEILLRLARVNGALERVESSRRYLEAAGTLLAQGSFDAELEADYLNELGTLQARESRFEKARTTLEQALEVLSRESADNSLRAADIHATLANMFMVTSDHQAMLASGRRALEIVEASESAYSSRLVTPLRSIGWALVMLDDLPGARAALERALEIAVGNYGDTHYIVAAVHNSMGLLTYYEKRLWDAIGHVEEQIRIYRALYGPDTPLAEDAIGNLGMLYTDVGAMERAGELFAERMAGLDPQKAEDRAGYYTVLSNEARRLQAIGDYEKAARLHEESRAIRAELFGPDSRQVADAEDDIALALYRLGHYAEAERWFNAGLEKIRQIEGEDSEAYRKKLRYRWRYDVRRGDLLGARDKLHEIMMEDVENDELDAIWPVHMLSDLADLNLRLGDLDRARQALDWAARGAASAPEHPSAFYASLIEAEYHRAAGNGTSAARLARHSLEGFEKRYPLLQSRAERARKVLNAVTES